MMTSENNLRMTSDHNSNKHSIIEKVRGLLQENRELRLANRSLHDKLEAVGAIARNGIEQRSYLDALREIINLLK